jgi:NADP-dependent 3-hydroxy acid dehydrogenase YdfG
MGVIIVTGAASGIGAATAKLLSRQGTALFGEMPRLPYTHNRQG